MVLFCAPIRRDAVFLLRFPFLSHVQVFSCEMSFVISIELFSFPFLFSDYFCSVDPRVVCIVFDGCNQSSSALFNVVFESFHQCINGIKSSSSFFSWHIQLLLLLLLLLFLALWFCLVFLLLICVWENNKWLLLKPFVLEGNTWNRNHIIIGIR